MVQFETIKRDSAIESLIKQIKTKIKDGTLQPGEKLPSERKLAEQVGIGRTSVREAIQALSFSGYLDVIQGKGVYVGVSARKYDELFELFETISGLTLDHVMEARMVIEGGAARLAAIKANEEDIENMIACYEEMINAETLRLFFIKDLKFHIAIAETTKNPIIKSLMQIIGEKLHQETSQLIEMSQKTRQQGYETLQNVIDAIKDGDPESAQQSMITHLQDVEKQR